MGFRVGGEEFLVVLSGASLRSAISVTRALRRRISESIEVEVRSLTVSVGVAAACDGQTAAEWVRRAVRQLDAAKARGRVLVAAER